MKSLSEIFQLFVCLVLVLHLALSASNEGDGRERDALLQSLDLMTSMMPNDEFFERRLQQDVQINECLDATEWFPWEDQNQGDNYFRLYFECKCSGDFRSQFQLVCTLNDYCFTADDGVTEQCITRTHSYDFSVDPETGFILHAERYERGLSLLKNFPILGNFTYINPSPCTRTVLSIDEALSVREAQDLCVNLTACQSFLVNASYTDDEIEYLCPFISFNGEKCQSYELGDCQEYTNDTFWSTMPDCSNVEPCLTSSCQKYPIIDTSPERQLYRYPECSNEDPSLSPTFNSFGTMSPISRPPTSVTSDVSLAPSIANATSSSPTGVATQPVAPSSAFAQYLVPVLVANMMMAAALVLL